MSPIAAASRRCARCDRNYPQHGSVCQSCKAPAHYNQDQDQGKQPGLLLPFREKQFPGPGCNADAPTRPRALVVKQPNDCEQPELHRLEDAHDEGRLEPLDVRLGEMPPTAGPIMHSIAEHMRLRMGLRLAVGDDRPLPYATSEAVRAGLAKDKPTASNAINALVRAGVVEYVGRLKPLRPGLDGTKLYAPPGEKGGQTT